MSDTQPKANRWLVVMRHAKSAWPDVADTRRPLAKRGQRDAPEAGAWLREHGRAPDRVLCSPARRARQTWELAATGLPTSPPVTHDPRIYEAGVTELLRVISECPDRVGTLLLVGHEPAMRELTLYLAGRGSDRDALERVRAKFPTSGIAVLAVPVGWAALTARVARLAAFAVPRG